jgi:hypothetical protein
MGLGGAYVALADDPQCGFLNPAALRTLKKVGMDASFSAITHTGPDHFILAFSNPGNDKGAALAMGAYSQGLAYKNRLSYWVPYMGSSFDLSATTHLGLITRFAYLDSEIDSFKSGWKTVADLTAVQTFQSLRVAGAFERAFGGSAGGLIPRRVRAGGAFVSSTTGIIISYEWRAEETRHTLNFHWSTSHYGAELPIGDYAAFRVGYVSGDEHRYAFGVSAGDPKDGWRVEGGWNLPATGRRDETRWSVGMAFRN